MPRRDARPRIILATAVWQRHELTRAVLRHYVRIRRAIEQDIDLRLLAVGSEGQLSRQLCEELGFDYVEYTNEPLSYKYNALIGACTRYHPDAVVLVNSDDLVESSYFRACVEQVRSGCDYFGFRGTYVLDLVTLTRGLWPGYESSYMQFRVGEPAGCGRCFSRRLLEAMQWKLWPDVPRRNNSLDFWCTRYLQLGGFHPSAPTMTELGARAVQIKSDVGITKLSLIPLEGIECGESAWEWLEGFVDAREVASLQSVHEQLAPAATGEPYHYINAERTPILDAEDIPWIRREMKLMRAHHGLPGTPSSD